MRSMFLSVLIVLCGRAFGQLYAVDSATTLVTVDPDTGAVTELGPVHVMGAGLASMEFVGPRLFAVDRAVPSGAWIVEIDPASGAELSRAALTLDGAELTNAVEGLGYDAAAGSLVVAFWQAPAAITTNSNTLGLVGASGVVTEPVWFGEDADFDGLAARAGDGSMYWIDREPGESTVEIGVLMRGGGASSLGVHPFSGEFNGVNEVVLASDLGVLLATDSITRMVHQLDPDTGELLTSIAYDANYTLSAPAYRPPCAPDMNSDGVLDFFDVQAFLNDFSAANPIADLTGDGVFDFFDVQAFLNAFSAGCP